MEQKRLTKAEIQEKKDFAKILFIRENMTQKEIAARICISQNTVSKWANDENWEAAKKSTMLTREEQIRSMLSELEMINIEISCGSRGYATKEQAYVRDTLIQNLQKLETETSATEVYNVARKMITFYRAIDLDKAKEITELFDVFLKSILK
ncbi:helix-turn-helix domain-containing protein [Sphingobacterium sp. LRF_L2]|uniref:helix-turn-helix domain-containing protein n=1 Tax=Sphingobacterium sp. LRF_L2 TaxID=3369421 RepID=UPI003F63660A